MLQILFVILVPSLLAIGPRRVATVNSKPIFVHCEKPGFSRTRKIDPWEDIPFISMSLQERLSIPYSHFWSLAEFPLAKIPLPLISSADFLPVGRGPGKVNFAVEFPFDVVHQILGLPLKIILWQLPHVSKRKSSVTLTFENMVVHCAQRVLAARRSWIILRGM